jgi:HptB-dependent secretion and biofilm anti anti-sigma factor
MLTPITAQGNDTMNIQIPNPFTYQSRKEFLPVVKSIVIDTNSELTLDFNGVDMIDSSALGMLLIAREKARGTEGRVSLINCNDKIKKILTVAQFDMLFKIP